METSLERVKQLSCAEVSEKGFKTFLTRHGSPSHSGLHFLTQTLSKKGSPAFIPQATSLSKPQSGDFEEQTAVMRSEMLQMQTEIQTLKTSLQQHFESLSPSFAPTPVLDYILDNEK